jgi:hypothetical protein
VWVAPSSARAAPFAAAAGWRWGGSGSSLTPNGAPCRLAWRTRLHLPVVDRAHDDHSLVASLGAQIPITLRGHGLRKQDTPTALERAARARRSFVHWRRRAMRSVPGCASTRPYSRTNCTTWPSTRTRAATPSSIRHLQPGRSRAVRLSGWWEWRRPSAPSLSCAQSL